LGVRISTYAFEVGIRNIQNTADIPWRQKRSGGQNVEPCGNRVGTSIEEESIGWRYCRGNGSGEARLKAGSPGAIPCWRLREGKGEIGGGQGYSLWGS
jgi:hypothetical protein